MRLALYCTGLAIVVGSLTTMAMAGGPAGVPEINGASISTGLGLLSGGILILRARSRR